MRTLTVLAILGFLPLIATPTTAVEAQCIGIDRGVPGSDDYECVGAYVGGGENCIGVFHNHPNPGHPDGCTGLDNLNAHVTIGGGLLLA